MAKKADKSIFSWKRPDIKTQTMHGKREPAQPRSQSEGGMRITGRNVKRGK